MRFVIIIAILALFGFVMATMNASEIAGARQIIDSNVSCSSLSQAQLELLGDYYMEQMHPGDAHDAMERMMGGEGSDSLRSAHIQMAEVLYCGRADTPATYGGMMGMMPMMGRFANRNPPASSAYRGYGMMGGYGGMMGYGGGTDYSIWLAVLAVVVLALLAAIWIYWSAKGSRASAFEILKRRYASGEITKRQYEEMKKEFGG
ncbi:MAG: SHOCT domain-containing protein [Nitrospiraceae bacterium]|nr:SHOCT domain-containing protein [Nitrospiraceae bacterium]